MKSKRHSIPPRLLAALCAGAMSTAVIASGSHAGGHGHAHGATPTQTAIGEPGVADQVTRTLAVDMSDQMRFTPSDIRVRRGETVRFVIRNTGQLKHEFSLGTRQELAAHYELMKKFPDMVHDEPNKVSLAPGEQGEVLWRFTRAGTVDFACLYPGHYEAGMKGRVRVGK